MKNIFIINGSASENSSNQKIITNFIQLCEGSFNSIIYNDLKYLPHFDPELSIENTPQEIVNFRKYIENADGILFCTPEYIFSIPSGLKNALEWCVSTTVFSEKMYWNNYCFCKWRKRTRGITFDNENINDKF